MSKDSEEFVVAGNGGIYIAPVGTTLPANETVALHAAFTELGYATEDGVTVGASLNVEEIRSWQSATPTRRILTERDYTITAELQQWNELNFQTAFGGGEVSQITAGHYRYSYPSDSDALGEHACIVDWVDGDKKYRQVFPRVSPSDGGEFNLNRTSLSTLQLSLMGLKPDNEDATYLLTNDPAFAPAS